MTTFGTSAYLKLLALNPQPRDTEIRKRFASTGNGYDFHKAMRHISTDYASRSIDWRTAEARLKAIKQLPERNSATSATNALANWVGGRRIRPIKGLEISSPSPNDVFKVRFSPDFEIDIDGVTTQVHIWNTAKPALKLREAIGTLGLFLSGRSPRTIGVLSLRSGELFVPTDGKSASELARLLAIDVEKRFTRIQAEYRDRISRREGTEKRASR